MSKILGIILSFAFWIAPVLAAQLALAAPPAAVKGASLLDGHEVSVTAENKKGLVLIFLSAQCPCSNSHLQELKNLAHDFPQFAFAGIHANAGEEKNATVSYFTKAALPFPVLRDHEYKLADQYRALKTPHAFVLMPDGQIVYRGGVSSSHNFESADRKYLREALSDLAQGHAVKTPEGRTLGCAIARGEKNVW